MLNQFCKLQKRFEAIFMPQSSLSTRTLQQADIDPNSKMQFLFACRFTRQKQKKSNGTRLVVRLVVL